MFFIQIRPYWMFQYLNFTRIKNPSKSIYIF
nr:MAG TPA: hypothetical protein [Caudoviricetes sp.]